MPNDKFNAQERIYMVEKYIETGRNTQAVIGNFVVDFPNAPNIPSPDTIKRAYRKFKNVACLDIQHRKIEYPSRQLSEEAKIAICAAVEVTKRTSTTICGRLARVSQSSAHQTLKANRYKPGAGFRRC